MHASQKWVVARHEFSASGLQHLLLATATIHSAKFSLCRRYELPHHQWYHYCDDEAHTMGVYGLWQILSMTTTMAMMVATSTPGRTTRLNTSSPSVATGLDATPAFFLTIRAASLPPPPRRILQLRLEKEPSTR